LPLVKRLPRKGGFTNIFKTEYAIVNVARLNIFEPQSEVTPEKLLQARLISSLRKPVKILGDGDLERPLIVKANKFSATAKEKIERAGGRAEEVSGATAAG
jgi:large subunit ribosomal protein L15